MRAKATLAGHSLHQMLIVFPVGLLLCAVIFDCIYLYGRNERLGNAAFWMIGVGVIGGLVAAVFGIVDWVSLPPSTRAVNVGFVHGVGNAIVLVLFAGSWALRKQASPHMPGAGALVLSFVGTCVMLVTGWLGWEMVYRLGVGVDEGAHADAPTSLSDRSASKGGAAHAPRNGGSTPAAGGLWAGRRAQGAARHDDPHETDAREPSRRRQV